MEEEYLRSPLSGVSVGMGIGILGWELGTFGPARFFWGAQWFVLLGKGFSVAEGFGAASGSSSGMWFSGLSWHQGEEEVEQVPAEILYQGLLPSLPQYMVSWGALGSAGSVPFQ